MEAKSGVRQPQLGCQPQVPHSAGMPLDTARMAFDWLGAGPEPVSIDGRLFSGLPKYSIPLAELRDRLLMRDCPQRVRDAVWAHFVRLARVEGATWTVACVGLALPALTRVAATLCSRFAADPADIHAAILAGFLTELHRVDLSKPRIVLRLRWAAYRAGYATVREALDAAIPMDTQFHSTEPPQPWGHPDLVLARAVTDNVITSSEAELIGSTRLEGVALASIADSRQMTYKALHQARRRAERRLTDYLSNHDERDGTVRCFDKSVGSVSKKRTKRRVQRCGTRPNRTPRKNSVRPSDSISEVL